MSRIFKCHDCEERIDFEQGEVYALPGPTIYDAHSGIRLGTGHRYCKNCYDKKINSWENNHIRTETEKADFKQNNLVMEKVCEYISNNIKPTKLNSKIPKQIVITRKQAMNCTNNTQICDFCKIKTRNLIKIKHDDLIIIPNKYFSYYWLCDNCFNHFKLQ